MKGDLSCAFLPGQSSATLQLSPKKRSRTSNPRHNGTNGNVEDSSNLLVLKFLHIAEENHFEQRCRQLLQSSLKRNAIAQTDEIHFGSLPINYPFRVLSWLRITIFVKLIIESN